MTSADGALKKLLVALAREETSEEGFMWSKRLPRDLSGDVPTIAHLSRNQASALAEAEVAVAEDLRFEHLDKSKVTNAVWRFAAQCLLRQKGDLVAEFAQHNGKKMLEVTCYLPVRHLLVDREEVIAGLTLLPPSDERVPKDEMLEPGTDVGAFAAVPVKGTSYGRMAERARERAEHSLRVARIALRAHRAINDKQLRFTIGTTYSFGSHGGWKSGPGDAWPLGPLNDELRGLITTELVGALPFDNGTDIEKAAKRAAAWLERAQFAGDPLIEMLYAFFALETVVGDKASGAKGTKGHVVAFRQALLSSIVHGGFTDPDETLIYYDEVRSNAVHGSEPMIVDERTSGHVAWGVRVALADYLQLAKDQSLTRRSKLLDYLKDHPDESKLRDWLRVNGIEAWKKYLDLEQSDRAEAAEAGPAAPDD